MKDQCALMGLGLVCALAAWTFWHYAGPDGWGILTGVALLCLVLDNRRLRARLRAYQQPG